MNNKYIQPISTSENSGLDAEQLQVRRFIVHARSGILDGLKPSGWAEISWRLLWLCKACVLDYYWRISFCFCFCEKCFYDQNKNKLFGLKQKHHHFKMEVVQVVIRCHCWRCRCKNHVNYHLCSFYFGLDSSFLVPQTTDTRKSTNKNKNNHKD